MWFSQSWVKSYLIKKVSGFNFLSVLLIFFNIDLGLSKRLFHLEGLTPGLVFKQEIIKLSINCQLRLIIGFVDDVVVFVVVDDAINVSTFFPQALDKSGAGTCSLLEFRQMMRKFKIDLNEEEFFHLFSFYDKNMTGKISYNDFLRAHLE